MTTKMAVRASVCNFAAGARLVVLAAAFICSACPAQPTFLRIDPTTQIGEPGRPTGDGGKGAAAALGPGGVAVDGSPGASDSGRTDAGGPRDAAADRDASASGRPPRVDAGAIAGRDDAGAAATGGRGPGDAATAGMGPGGSTGAGSTGGAGGGSLGAGGAAGAGGENCITAIQVRDYSYPGASPCSACRENGVSLAVKCRAMIDCLATAWPYTPNERSDCLNAASGSAPVDGCVQALTLRSCGM